MNPPFILLLFVVVSHLSNAVADEGLAFVDRWHKTNSESSTEFVFKKNGIFYAYEVTQIKVLGETKFFRSYLKGTWNSKQDPSRITANVEGLTHLIASDTGSSSLKRSKEFHFLVDNNTFFIVIDGKPQRELLKSTRAAAAVENEVRQNLK